MKKRIICLLAIVTMLSSMLVMNVNADMVYKENYDAFPNDTDPLTTTTFRPHGSATGIEFDNGTVKIYNDENTSPIFYLDTKTSNQDYVLMFDMKQNQSWAVGGYIFRGDYRFGGVSPQNPEANLWYTHLIILSEDGEGTATCYYYRKLQEEPASDFEFVTSKPRPTEANSGTASLLLNFGDPDNDINRYNGYALWIDNVEVHTGMYFSEKTFLANDTTPVASLSEVPEGTATITARVDIYNADIAQGDITDEIPVTPVLVSFDASGKMLNCELATTSIKALDNDSNAFSITCPYESTVSRMQLLMWDSIEGMQAIFEPIELQ